MLGKLLILCVAVAASLAEIEIPDYLLELRCRKSDPNYNTCVTTNVEKMFPYFINGIKELNIPPLDPLKVEHFEINRTVNDAVDIRLVIDNMKLTGIKDVIFQRIKGDPIKLKGEMNLLVPKIHLNLEYDVQGKVFGNDINVQGTLDGEFRDIAIATRTKERRYTGKDGVEHFAIDKFDIKFALGDGKIKLTANTPEQQATVQFVEQLFNNNPRGIMDAVAPIAIEQGKGMFIDRMNDVLAQIPASLLLPE